MDGDAGLGEVKTVALFGKLQQAAVVADAIVVADDALVLGAEDVSEIADEGDEGVTLLGDGHRRSGRCVRPCRSR